MDPSYEQLSLFENKPIPDPRPPETVTWNGIHGCRKVSPGCLHCYMFRRDESVGKDPTIVRKTQSFNLPVRRLRAGAYKGLYKIPSGSHIFTCFSSDFFHKDADDWRDEMCESPVIFPRTGNRLFLMLRSLSPARTRLGRINACRSTSLSRSITFQ